MRRIARWLARKLLWYAKETTGTEVMRACEEAIEKSIEKANKAMKHIDFQPLPQKTGPWAGWIEGLGGHYQVSDEGIMPLRPQVHAAEFFKAWEDGE